MTIHLTIPLDPTGLSMNRWNKLHWSKKASIKRQWTVYVQLMAHARVKKPSVGERPAVTITCYFRTKHARDKDNFAIVAKCCLDGLTNARVIEDDNSTAIDLRPLEFDYDKDNPRVEIEIEEMGAR